MASVVIRAVTKIRIPLSFHHKCNIPIVCRTTVWASLARTLASSTISQTSRKFSEKHEWVAVDGKIGIIGITDYAQEALGDIVYAQLPDVGAEFSQHDECGALESVKAASEIYSPVSGKVMEVNGELEDQPSLINQSCYDKGWLFKMELSNPDELCNLMDEDGYNKFLKEQ